MTSATSRRGSCRTSGRDDGAAYAPFYTDRVNPRHRRYIIPVALLILILISVVAQIIGK